MERRKIVRGTIYLKERMLFAKEDNGIGGLKYFESKDYGMLVVEVDGQSYISLNWCKGRPWQGIMLPIKEKFDDLEGEEIKAGGNASETEE